MIYLLNHLGKHLLTTAKTKTETQSEKDKKMKKRTTNVYTRKFNWFTIKKVKS